MLLHIVVYGKITVCCDVVWGGGTFEKQQRLGHDADKMEKKRDDGRGVGKVYF